MKSKSKYQDNNFTKLNKERKKDWCRREKSKAKKIKYNIKTKKNERKRMITKKAKKKQTKANKKRIIQQKKRAKKKKTTETLGKMTNGIKIEKKKGKK